MLTSAVAFAATRAPAEALRPLEVADAIETTRLFPNASTDGSSSAVAISPDRDRYVVRLLRGDVKSNGVWLSVLRGDLASVESAHRPVAVGQLFARGYGKSLSFHYPLVPPLNPLIWVDNSRAAFLWEDDREALQVIATGSESGAIKYLTHHPSDVVTFSQVRNNRFIFAAKQASGKIDEGKLKTGFAVESADAFSLLSGNTGPGGTLDQLYNFEVFVRDETQDESRRIDDLVHRWIVAFRPLMSEDGRYALVNASPRKVSPQWTQYEPLDTAEHIDFVSEALRDQGAWYGRQLTQLFIVDASRAIATPLWDVPTSNPYKLKAAWSPDSRSVLIGPTFVPGPEKSVDARGGWGFVEVRIETGDVRQLPTPFAEPPESVDDLAWLGPDDIRLTADGHLLLFRRSEAGWQLSDRRSQSNHAPADLGRIKIQLEQGLNSPPVLYAVDTYTREKRVALDLNPDLKRRFSLAHVEHMTFDSEGEAWSALLYYPVRYTPGKRFPLVIQTHGHALADEFSLYGPGDLAPGLGPGWSIYAAQVLAGRDIAVIQIEDKRGSGGADEPVKHMRAYEAAVAHLVAQGLVDASRVGLSGFSRTGWHVEYALTHSDFPYAAAVASDHMSAGYLESTLVPGSYEREIGASPFSSGLRYWLERSPAFNAERVRTPLRLQAESGGLVFAALSRWEMFSRLRQLKKPVDFYVIPRIDRGSHNIQNPEQCLASQQGAVDWFDFWLNGRENPHPRDPDQNKRWRRLRELRESGI
jgi:dipeptidyl aminopeptidase/acylaminoacyl peptidase